MQFRQLRADCIFHSISDCISVTLVFKADGNVIDTKNIAYNANLGVSELPSIPDKDGYYAQWPEYSIKTNIAEYCC